MKVTGMEMNHIEFAGVLDHVVYQNHFPSHWILAALILAKRATGRRNKPCGCDRVAAAKQSDLVTGANQFFCKIGNDSFCPSIMFWRHTLD